LAVVLSGVLVDPVEDLSTGETQRADEVIHLEFGPVIGSH